MFVLLIKLDIVADSYQKRKLHARYVVPLLENFLLIPTRKCILTKVSDFLWVYLGWFDSAKKQLAVRYILLHDIYTFDQIEC